MISICVLRVSMYFTKESSSLFGTAWSPLRSQRSNETFDRRLRLFIYQFMINGAMMIILKHLLTITADLILDIWK